MTLLTLLAPQASTGISGIGSITLADLASQSSGAVEVSGAGSAQINLACQATGIVEIIGAGAVTFTNVTESAAGVVSISSVGAITLTSLMPSAVGSVSITGISSITLAGITSIATAGLTPITGQGTTTFSNLTGLSNGAVNVSGSGFGLVNVIGYATGAVVIAGSGIAQLVVSESSSGKVLNAGMGARQLANLTSQAAARAQIACEAAVIFASLIAAATGAVVTVPIATRQISISLGPRSFVLHLNQREYDLSWHVSERLYHDKS
jgi:hypothetical protein